MAKVTTHVQDPSVTIEHWIHRLESGAYTYSTRTTVTMDSDIEHAAELAAELARKADHVARRELIRRLTGDAEALNNEEYKQVWQTVQTRMEEQKIV